MLLLLNRRRTLRADDIVTVRSHSSHPGEQQVNRRHVRLGSRHGQTGRLERLLLQQDASSHFFQQCGDPKDLRVIAGHVITITIIIVLIQHVAFLKCRGTKPKQTGRGHDAHGSPFRGQVGTQRSQDGEIDVELLMQLFGLDLSHAKRHQLVQQRNGSITGRIQRGGLSSMGRIQVHLEIVGRLLIHGGGHTGTSTGHCQQGQGAFQTQPGVIVVVVGATVWGVVHVEE
mmetsp:Transcript_5526/g.15563  ORF Transcript_5526/g.15563 Transcript_5526/m.15563 type:complete len:229 (+) Transcript_5526:550-1236(+)